LAFEDIKRICNILDIEAVNLGTGESVLHPRFNDILDYLYEREITISLTTNGLSVLRLAADRLKYFNDIDISLDFPDPKRHNHFRGYHSYENALEGIERCKALKIECSIVTCLMNINYLVMEDLVSLASEMDVNLRVNVYKPVHSDLFSPSFSQFWEGIRLLFTNSRIVSCSEPIVNVALKISGVEAKTKGIQCGNHSFRVHPDRTIRPCVYWPYANGTIDDIDGDKFLTCDAMKILPKICLNCEYVEMCQGGCPSRRIFKNPNEPDEFCPVLHNDAFLPLKVSFSGPKSLVHSNYLCTIIVEGDNEQPRHT